MLYSSRIADLRALNSKHPVTLDLLQ